MLSTPWYSLDYSIVLPYELAHQRRTSPNCSVQNFAARVVTGSRKLEYMTPVLRDLNWLPVSNMLTYTVGTLTFKCVNGLAPRYLCSRLVTGVTVHDRNTRKNKLDIPGYKSAAGQRSFLYRSVTMWNSLPTECYHRLY